MRKTKNPFNKIRSNTILAKILISIGEVGDLSITYIKNKNSIKKSLKRLIQRKLVKEEKNGKLHLTDLGLVEFLKLELSQTDLLPKGKICIVVFDIPEISRSWRDILRKFLRDSCFFPLQKSVWISQFDAAEKLSKIFNLLNLKKWIKVYNATEVGTE